MPGIKLLGHMCIWRYSIWRRRLQATPSEPFSLNRRENWVLRKTETEFIICVPYVVLWLIPILGNVLLPAALLFSLSFKPTAVPHFFWSDRIFTEQRVRKWALRTPARLKLLQSLRSFLNTDPSDLRESSDELYQIIDTMVDSIHAGESVSMDALVSLAPLLSSSSFQGPGSIGMSEEHLTYLLEANNIFVTAVLRPFPKLFVETHFLMVDDAKLLEEGIDNLTPADLLTACEARGIWVGESLYDKTESEIREFLPYPDDESLVTPLTAALRNWLKLSAVIRTATATESFAKTRFYSRETVLVYAHIMGLYSP